MSNDDIKPGDRFERIGDNTPGARMGVIFTAKGIFLGHSWDVEESVSRGWTLGDSTRWRRLPCIDAPAAVKADCDGCFGYEAAHEPACESPKAEEVELPPHCCKTDCAPAAPCWTQVDDFQCPGFREQALKSEYYPWYDKQHGISPDALPPARASSYVPKCAELAGWGSWDGGQRKQ